MTTFGAPVSLLRPICVCWRGHPLLLNRNPPPQSDNRGVDCWARTCVAPAFGERTRPGFWPRRPASANFARGVAAMHWGEQHASPSEAPRGMKMKPVDACLSLCLTRSNAPHLFVYFRVSTSALACWRRRPRRRELLLLRNHGFHGLARMKPIRVHSCTPWLIG